MENLSRRTFITSTVGLMTSVGLLACSPSPAPPATTKDAAPAPKPADAAAQKPAAAVPPAAPAAKADTSKPAAGAPKKGGKVTFGRPADVLHFDTSQLSGTQDPIFFQVFSTLIRLDDKVQPQPDLAESWEMSADQKKLTLKLRKGVTFHSGKELTADDVVATILRYQDEKTAANIRPQVLRFKDPKAIDKNTVEINFDAPMATVFDALDLMFIWDKDNFNDIKQKPNGTGPFKLAQWQPGESVRLVRHDGYHKQGLPYLDELTIKTYPDFEGLMVALETGAVDMAGPLRPRDRKRMESRKEVQVVPGVRGTSVFDVNLNVTRPPFTDKRVRQAISYAIDRQRFVDTYLSGDSEPWSLPWPPHSPAFDKELNGTYAKQDLDKAKKLMAEAGLASGFETTILATKGRPGYMELAELVQGDLEKIGIKTKIEVLEEAAWRPKHIGGDLNIATHSFGRATKHPASMLEQAVVWRPDKNSASYQSEAFTKLSKDASTTFDAAKSKQIYADINKLILDECFTLVIAPDGRSAGLRQHVKGYASNLEDWPLLEGLWVDK
ncbi:MAG: ABC transporter substrate-binding protein [Chloroflexota bacterium]